MLQFHSTSITSTSERTLLRDITNRLKLSIWNEGQPLELKSCGRERKCSSSSTASNESQFLQTPFLYTKTVLSSVDDFDKFKKCKNTSIFNTVYGLEPSKGSSRLIDVPKGCTLSLWCPLLAFIPSSALLAPATNRNTQSNLMLPPSCLTTRKVFVC